MFMFKKTKVAFGAGSCVVASTQKQPVCRIYALKKLFLKLPS